MSLEDCYTLFNLPPDAGVEEIKRAYRKMAKLYHPDVNNSEDAQRMFVQVNQAYELLLYTKVYNPRMVYRSPVYDYYRPETRQERAERYARMRYEEFQRNNQEFKQSYIYMPVKIVTYMIGLMGVCIAATFILMPWTFMLFVDRRTGISMIPVCLIGFAVLNGVFRLRREVKHYF